jgi:two-component system sensor histidine kinase PilS (NtrC family)
MLARVIIVTFLLGIATFVDIKDAASFSAIFSSTLIKTILLTYVLSIFYLITLKYIPSLSVNIYLQSFCDVILITLMVYATGGIRSIYSIFYPLVIIYSVLFLGRRGGFIVASTAGIFYGFFANLEFYGVIYPNQAILIWDYPLHAGYVLTRILTHILSFYLIAFLTSFVVEQEKRARALLAEKQSAFDQLDLLHRSIIASVDTGIMTVNLNGQIKSFNRAAVEITGFQFKQIENRHLSEVFQDFPSLQPGATEAGGGGAKTRFELPCCAKNGEKLILGCSVSALRAPGGNLIGSIIIFQDLTQINEMRESIEKNRRFAFIGEMAAGLAHEIRNPLASITGSIQILRQDLTLSETNEKLMQIILRGKEQLEGFLRDFLLMTRPAPGMRTLFDVREIVREVLESLRYVPDWLDERHRVVVELPVEPLLIQANKTEIRQILWNVILNALQAMPSGGTLEVKADLLQSEERMRLRITDTGSGIADTDLQKIFEPFFTTREEGTGLGLAVVRRIIEYYGGKIDIRSRAHQGTICTLWLPREKSPQEAPASIPVV